MRAARTAQFDKMQSRMSTDDNQKFVPAKALYWSDTRVLKRFDGCHPAIMADWIKDHSEHDFWPDRAASREPAPFPQHPHDAA